VRFKNLLVILFLLLGLNWQIEAKETTSIQGTTALNITNVSVVDIESFSAKIVWTTDDLSDSLVFYGTSQYTYVYSSSRRCDADYLTTLHCVLLSNLNPGTTYYFVVESKNINNLAARSGEFSFVTLSNTSQTAATTSDTTPPRVSNFYFSTESVRK
jgi:hypothetical protein